MIEVVVVWLVAHRAGFDSHLWCSSMPECDLRYRRCVCLSALAGNASKQKSLGWCCFHWWMSHYVAKVDCAIGGVFLSVCQSVCHSVSRISRKCVYRCRPNHGDSNTDKLEIRPQISSIARNFIKIMIPIMADTSKDELLLGGVICHVTAT